MRFACFCCITALTLTGCNTAATQPMGTHGPTPVADSRSTSMVATTQPIPAIVVHSQLGNGKTKQLGPKVWSFEGLIVVSIENPSEVTVIVDMRHCELNWVNDKGGWSHQTDGAPEKKFREAGIFPIGPGLTKTIEVPTTMFFLILPFSRPEVVKITSTPVK